jgi:hypothetical protein
MRPKPQSHFCEVDRAMAFMDLDGVPATQRNLRAAFAFEIGKLAPSTRWTIVSRLSGCDLSAVVVPKVE